jgi:hypothetical protein
MAAAAGKEIDCILLDTDLEMCLSRNAARTFDRVVPEKHVRATHHRLVVCPPNLDEGWQRVVRVGPDLTALGAPRGGQLDSSGGRL